MTSVAAPQSPKPCDEQVFVYLEPTRPKTAYFLYLAEEMATHTNEKRIVQANRVSAEWNHVEAGRRRSYNDKAGLLPT